MIYIYIYSFAISRGLYKIFDNWIEKSLDYHVVKRRVNLSLKNAQTHQLQRISGPLGAGNGRWNNSTARRQMNKHKENDLKE